MNLNTKFDHIVKARLTPVLAAQDFKRKRYVYERKQGDVSWIVEVQRSQWSDASVLDFTMNCGVYISGVVSTFALRPEPKNPKIIDCCVGSRLGMLRPERKDKWWRVTAEDADQAFDDRVGEEVCAEVGSIVLPFLRLFPSQTAVAEFLSDVPSEYRQVFPMQDAQRSAYAAIIFTMVGDARAAPALQSAVAQAAGTPLESVVARLDEFMRTGRPEK